MSPRIDILRLTLAVVLACVGFLALMAVPCEDMELPRWIALMLVSKAVGFGAMGTAVWLLQRNISDGNI